MKQQHLHYCLQAVVLVTVALFIAQRASAQVTVYAHPYPKGIVTKEVNKETGRYRLYPIDNPNLRISILPKELIQIIYEDGRVVSSDKTLNGESLVFSTEPRTGKIKYEGNVSFPEKDKTTLFNAYNQLTIPNVRLKLMSEDMENHSYLNYQVIMSADFAGDRYSVTYLVKLRFNEGEVTYELAEFEAFWLNIKSLDMLYAWDSRNGDIKKFWTPIKTAISETEKAIRDKKP